MALRGIDGLKNVRVSREDYLKALEDASEEFRLNGQDESPADSEAERLARDAEPPRARKDGKPVGSEKHRPLTSKQFAFARGLIEGKTQEQAYRDAYPDAQANAQAIKASAWKLAQDQRIQKMLQEHWGETAEAMVDDEAATKRFVMKTLLHYAKAGKQEGTRLKALEMMGKTIGMFAPQAKADDPEELSAEQLMRELSKHRRMLANVRPMSRAQVIELEPEPMPITNANV